MSAISSFVPLSAFFTVSSGLSQTEAQAFGPKGVDLFSLTAKFTSTGAKAFAICKGVVLVQPQTGNANAVNLILRPYEQPIAGFNIKYFVYRGLKKSNFFTGNNVLAKTASTSDFINKINDSFSGFYSGQTVPPFLAKYIGFDPDNQANALPLDMFFFKEAEYVDSSGEFIEKEGEAFELPMIGKGLSLGEFITGECGIDVVLNYGDYQLPQPNDEFVFDLNYARSASAKIDLALVTDPYQRKLKKEQIFQFLDVAAFYGFHYSNGTVEADGAKKKGVDIYNDLVSKFWTKNSLYLYIQSDRGRSYNFYGNYFIEEDAEEDLVIGVDETSMAPDIYGHAGWPLIIKSDPQNHGNPENSLLLQLVTDNNADAMLYGQVASIRNAVKNNFIDAEHLKLEPDAGDEPGVLTSKVILVNPAVGNNGAKFNIASFNILVYQGRANYYIAGQETDDQNVTTNLLAKANFFDDVFDVLNATPLLKANQDSAYSVLSSQRLKLVSHYYNGTQNGISAVQTLNVNDVLETGDVALPDVERVTYISETVDVLNTALSVKGTLTPDTRSNPSVSGATSGRQTYKLPDAFTYKLQYFTDSTESITGLNLLANDGSTPNKIILGLTKIENDTLKGLITAHNLINPRLFLIDLFDDGNELISAENIVYQKYSAGIVGENSLGELKLFYPEEDVMVYSLDRKYHFTAEYSKYVVEELDSSILFMDLDITI